MVDPTDYAWLLEKTSRITYSLLVRNDRQIGLGRGRHLCRRLLSPLISCLEEKGPVEMQADKG